jgi:hypothetical protein
VGRGWAVSDWVASAADPALWGTSFSHLSSWIRNTAVTWPREAGRRQDHTRMAWPWPRVRRSRARSSRLPGSGRAFRSIGVPGRGSASHWEVRPQGTTVKGCARPTAGDLAARQVAVDLAGDVAEPAGDRPPHLAEIRSRATEHYLRSLRRRYPHRRNHQGRAAWSGDRSGQLTRPVNLLKEDACATSALVGAADSVAVDTSDGSSRQSRGTQRIR